MIDTNNMKAIILAGGLGERLRPITYEIPKPLLPIHGKPIIQHLMELLKRNNIRDIILSIGYKAEMIKQEFEDGKKLELNIDYVIEKERLGTAGCLNLIKDKLTETFLMSNGDELKDFDLNSMIKTHKERGKKATILLLEVDDPTRYGIARMNGELIEEFIEKPKKEEAPSNLASAGLYILEPEILKLIEGKTIAMMEKDVFPQLAKEGELIGFKLKGQWFDTGTLERYEKAIKEWNDIK